LSTAAAATTTAAAAVTTAAAATQLASQVKSELVGKEDKTNKVKTLSAASTDDQYPSAKATWASIQNAIAQQSGSDYLGAYNYARTLSATAFPTGVDAGVTMIDLPTKIPYSYDGATWSALPAIVPDVGSIVGVMDGFLDGRGKGANGYVRYNNVGEWDVYAFKPSIVNTPRLVTKVTVTGEGVKRMALTDLGLDDTKTYQFFVSAAAYAYGLRSVQAAQNGTNVDIAVTYDDPQESDDSPVTFADLQKRYQPIPPRWVHLSTAKLSVSAILRHWAMSYGIQHRERISR
jgi:hypothetical protein